MAKAVDMIGRVFGRLTVLEQGATRRTASTTCRRWICRCSCGETKEIGGGQLRSGKARSCGCLQREETGKRARRHGLNHTPEYMAWQHMRDRCHNPKSGGYRLYGARGIGVCERWRYSFENFMADMGERPSPDHSVDRIDVNGNYEPSNCRWADRYEQARNTRRNRFVEVGGRRLCYSEWAQICGVSPGTISRRIRSGWDPARAVSAPAHIGGTPWKKGRAA